MRGGLTILHFHQLGLLPQRWLWRIDHSPGSSASGRRPAIEAFVPKIALERPALSTSMQWFRWTVIGACWAVYAAPIHGRCRYSDTDAVDMRLLLTLSVLLYALLGVITQRIIMGTVLLVLLLVSSTDAYILVAAILHAALQWTLMSYPQHAVPLELAALLSFLLLLHATVLMAPASSLAANERLR